MILFLWNHITIAPLSWESFFPKERTSLPAGWFDRHDQYLFLAPDKERLDVVDELAEEGYDILKLSESPRPLFLVLFPKSDEARVLWKLASVPKAGTVMVARALLDDFRRALTRYLAFVVPVLLVLAALVFPSRYLLDLALELSLYLLINLAVVSVTGTVFDIVSIMAGLFLAIYAVTLLNYIHLSTFDRKRLSVGIAVSMATTLVSALYLASSDFGLVASFGRDLTCGLLILGAILAVRIAMMHPDTPPPVVCFWNRWLPWLHIESGRGVRAFIALFILAAGTLLFTRPPIDLNPFNALPRENGLKDQVLRFEKEYLPTLPFILALRHDEGDYRLPEMAQAAAKRLEALEKELPIHPVATLPLLYRRFSGKPLQEANPASFDQFLLALEFENAPPLLSPDGRSVYAIYAVSALTPSEDLKRLSDALRHFFTGGDTRLELYGKIADFERMERRFTGEALGGFALSMLFVTLFFLWYCQTWRIVPVIALSASIPVVLHLALHLSLGIPLTLVSVIALILYAGLYADSFIHLFVCYAKERRRCLGDVLRPIFVSNATMIAALGGMGVSGSILAGFGWEMASLLLFNLLTVLFVLPYLLVRYVSRCAKRIV
ncbi:hypothetical protein [Hydrogenimonas sp.]